MKHLWPKVYLWEKIVTLVMAEGEKVKRSSLGGEEDTAITRIAIGPPVGKIGPASERIIVFMILSEEKP